MKVQNYSDLDKFNIMIRHELTHQGGTWSLKTMDWLRHNVSRFDFKETITLTKLLVEEFLKDNATSITRFKVAQLLSHLCFLKFPFFVESLIPYANDIKRIIGTRSSDVLWIPTIDLMQSILSNSKL